MLMRMGDAEGLSDRELCREAGALHAEMLRQGFLKELGPGFLALLYEAFARSPRAILIVHCAHGRVEGFVSGGEGLGGVYRQLLRRWPQVALAIAPRLLSIRRWRPMFELLSHTAQQVDEALPRAELYSIAVHASAQGSGCAQDLYRALRQAFSGQGVAEFRIVVGAELHRALAFYRKMGARAAARIMVHGGAESIVMVDGGGGAALARTEA